MIFIQENGFSKINFIHFQSLVFGTFSIFLVLVKIDTTESAKNYSFYLLISK